MDAEDDPITDEEMASNGTDEPRKAAMGGEAMDVEAYASLYSGRTKICRLLFIAGKCGNSNQTMALEALRMAYEEIKKGEDSHLHREVSAKIAGRLGPQYALDPAWSDAVDRRAEQSKGKLENEFNGYRMHLELDYGVNVRLRI